MDTVVHPDKHTVFRKQLTNHQVLFHFVNR
jgi:hypothetical protein